MNRIRRWFVIALVAGFALGAGAGLARCGNALGQQGLLGVATVSAACRGLPDPGTVAPEMWASSDSFRLAATADMRIYSGPGRFDTPHWFRGAVEAIAALDTDFMITPGDFDPAVDVYWTITDVLGADYAWYPVLGNHDLPGGGEEEYHGANLEWVLSYDYGQVNPGPSVCPTTTYSFDYGDAHFAVLNEYCGPQGLASTGGDVPDVLYDWLAQDLAASTAQWKFVVGHEPAYPQPDADTGRVRHVGDSLDAHPARRDRFWALLRQEGVLAYLCGHTHNYAAVQIDGVWQIDVGHARGKGDTGAPSTFVVLDIGPDLVRLETYRANREALDYRLTEAHRLAGPTVNIPLLLRATPL